jgi:hypothetical protein
MEERTAANVLRVRALEEALGVSFRSDREHQEEGDYSYSGSLASSISSLSSPYRLFLGDYLPLRTRVLPALLPGEAYGSRDHHTADDYKARWKYTPQKHAYALRETKFDIPIEVYLGRSNIASPMMRMGSYMKHCTSCGREWQPNLVKNLYGNDLYGTGN